MDGSQQHPLDELAEDFLAKYRAGSRPSLDELVAAHPEYADEIQEYIPALIALENMRPSGSANSLQSALLRHPPKQLGDYTIIREVGRGGMGVVYEAEQQSLGRRVALKVLPDSDVARPNVLSRFQREAMSGGRLHHNNIVPVFDVGQSDGLHYSRCN